jgi:cobalt-precorrin 5A hydrolase
VNEPAIVTLTPHGQELAQRIIPALGRGELVLAEGAVRERLTEAFQAGRPLICIMALGIVVRILGPLARDKQTDPPVVVIDEAGKFAISVLGGHGGGANALTRQVAESIGATPVITTASEGLGLPAIDLIGVELGWKIENREHLTAVAAAVVRGEPIAVYQDAGSQDWWREFGPWPGHFRRSEAWPEGNSVAVIAITDRAWPALACPHVMFRPPSLVFGIGCRRGVPLADIEVVFEEVCAKYRLASQSVAVAATVSFKADEPGLREFAARRRLPLRVFSVEELARVDELPTPSTRVFQKIGIYGVAEPSAMLAAGTQELLVTKHCSRKVTMAVARRADA